MASSGLPTMMLPGVFDHPDQLGVRAAVRIIGGGVSDIEGRRTVTLIAWFPIFNPGMILKIDGVVDMLCDVLHPGAPDQVRAGAVRIQIRRRITTAGEPTS